MLKIIFKNLEKSELAMEAVKERFEGLEDKFGGLKDHRMSVTLSMDNSPKHPGPDLFTVKLLIQGQKFRSIILEKSAVNLYIALADVAGHALERLNRFGDRTRMKRLRQERSFLSASERDEAHE